MKKMFDKLKQKFNLQSTDYDIPEELDEGYVEINTDIRSERPKKLLVRPFVINSFDDTKPILDALREGATIALVNISPLKQKDMDELRRAISKLKKTVGAVNGDIAGFGDDWIAITPEAASIHRTSSIKVKKETASSVIEEY